MRLGRRRFCEVIGVGGIVVTAFGIDSSAKERGAPHFLDHLILGCADLDTGIAYVQQKTGVQAAFGGVHPGRGTRNALLALGAMRYLEILAPDPAQIEQTWFPKLKEIKEPKIVGWAIHPGDLELQAKAMRENGIACLGPTEGSRKKADGTVLHWKTVNPKDDHGGLLPFLIEWSSDSKHPSEDAPKGCLLEAFYVRGPKPSELTSEIAKIPGVDIIGRDGLRTELVAEIAGPNGMLLVTS